MRTATVVAFGVGFAAGFFFGPRAHAHDIWTDAKEGNLPSGYPCCGGEAVGGDCEGLLDDQVREQPDGSVVIYSNRYKAQIHIPASRVMPDLPRYTDGPRKGEPLDLLVQFTAHYCGKPRNIAAYPVTPDDDDPRFHTYCFFRNGGGS